MSKDILKYSEENISNKWDYENGYYLTSGVNRLSKAITHYEIYKKIVGLPGDVMEFGVYKGASFIRWATYRRILENDYSRKLIGFDAFGEFPKTNILEDNEFIEKFEQDGGYGIDKDDFAKYLEYKKIDNITLIKGDILETLIEFLEENLYSKIALIHIDVDVYEPTKFILDNLYDKVVKGGIIAFDDYNAIEGETKAVDEFLKDKSEKIQKLSYSNTPSYIVKL